MASVLRDVYVGGATPVHVEYISYTTNVVRGAKAEAAFLEFIARRGRPLGGA